MLNIKVTSGLLGNTTFGAYYRSVAGSKESNAYTVLVELDDLEEQYYGHSWLIDRKNADTLCEMFKWDGNGAFTEKDVSPETVKKIAELAFLDSEANMHVWDNVIDTFKSFEHEVYGPEKIHSIAIKTGLVGISPEEFDPENGPAWQVNHIVALVSFGSGGGEQAIIQLRYHKEALEELLDWDVAQGTGEFLVDVYQIEQLERMAYMQDNFQSSMWGELVLDAFTPSTK